MLVSRSVGFVLDGGPRSIPSKVPIDINLQMDLKAQDQELAYLGIPSVDPPPCNSDYKG